MLVVLGPDDIHVVKSGTGVTICDRKIPIVVQYITTGKATCSECEVAALGIQPSAPNREVRR